MATEAYEDEGVEAEVMPEEDMASDFETFGAEALGISPDDPSAPTRLAALKEAIMSCVGTDYSKEKPGKGKGKEKGDALALVFGGE